MARKKKKKPGNKAQASREKPRAPAAAAAIESDPEAFQKDIEEIKNLLLVRRTSEALDLVDLLRSKRRLMTTNFILGLFRGIGFFLGVTIVGALILGMVALTFSWIESILGLEEGTAKSYLQEVVGQGETLKPENGTNSTTGDATVEDAVRKVLVEENLIPPPEEGDAGEREPGEGSGEESDSPPVKDSEER
jgi:hypothetical protein